MIKKILTSIGIKRVGGTIDFDNLLFGIRYVPSYEGIVCDSRTGEPVDLDALFFMCGPLVLIVMF